MEITLQIASDDKCLELFGPGDENLRIVRNRCGVQITARNGNIGLKGKSQDVKKAAEIIELMQKHLVKFGRVDKDDVISLMGKLKIDMESDQGTTIKVFSPKKSIAPYTKGQKRYIEAMLKSDLTFCTGPAGTGKTYLAVAVAVAMLKKKQIRKIVLARPAVEAGEKLGFLPGDLQAKVNPYLRPLFDSLEDMMEFEQMRRFIDMDIIEVIPLAFMRGRTLNEAVIICDEAQNTSSSQMMMFLTRMGRGSKMIITGDTTQIDLDKGVKSGMLDAMETLGNIDGISLIGLDETDIVRHNLVQSIVQAYEARKKKHS
ncbi:MAG: PhoH family protein [Anaerohalosphaeraceae bacterium]|nr:PhoH family protein [Anaerohalosphaeraceae bacterium]